MGFWNCFLCWFYWVLVAGPLPRKQRSGRSWVTVRPYYEGPPFSGLVG